MKLEEMPEVLTAQHIADYLGIARLTVYEQFNIPVERGGIPNFNIGKSRKTLKSDFILYLDKKRTYKDELATRRLNKIEGVRSIS
ncbi:hypothetical protein D3C75_479870 [compost metagenome]